MKNLVGLSLTHKSSYNIVVLQIKIYLIKLLLLKINYNKTKI